MLAQYPYEFIEEERTVTPEQFFSFLRDYSLTQGFVDPDRELVRFEMAYKEGRVSLRCLYKRKEVPPPPSYEDEPIVEFDEPITERSPVAEVICEITGS